MLLYIFPFHMIKQWWLVCEWQGKCIWLQCFLCTCRWCKLCSTLFYLSLFGKWILWSLWSGGNRHSNDDTVPKHMIRRMNLHTMLFDNDRQSDLSNNKNDRQSVDNCRMDRRTFLKLCHLLRMEGRLEGNRKMTIEEMVVIFLHIFALQTRIRSLSVK